MTQAIRLGIDVGGTFTDFVLATPGKSVFLKILTSASDPSEAILRGARELLDAGALSFAHLGGVIHATTAVANAIIERKGAKIGLLTTAGFRDSLEIGRETRYDLYDLFFAKPAPLVSRHLRCEVSERVSAQGDVVTPLCQNDVLRAADIFSLHKVEAIAVCFLHSYRNPHHEQLALKILRSRIENLPITLSSDIAPEIREYERACTASANAYVQPFIAAYLTNLTGQLIEHGYGGSTHLVLSSGGLTTVETAAKQPIQLIESGPAAGTMAAKYFSRRAGIGKMISFDMGGTTAKICVLEDGEPSRTSEFEAARVHRFRKGSGIPLKVPTVDLIEIGAGGGSLARVDSLGLMKIGPESAGSTPGPACYHRGGEQPTVTDADLILGYLAPDRFLGGSMALDVMAAHDAIERHLARPLDVGVEEAAAGVHMLVNETMAAAARTYLAEKGCDAREFTLFAFGGAGPVHAYGLATLLGISRIIVPPGAGVMSALGMLVAAPCVDLARGYIASLTHIDWRVVNAAFKDMEQEARRLLIEAGAAPEQIVLQRSADMRFVGQGHEISTPVPDGELECERRPEKLQADFIAEYERLFGRRLPGLNVEALTWRVRGTVRRELSENLVVARADVLRRPEAEYREAIFPGTGKIKCAVFDRGALPPGINLHGPALIEERESTTVVGPGATITVDAQHNLLVELTAARDRATPSLTS